MSETRRDALKLSVIGALGLGGCGTSGPDLLSIQPVIESQQPDILIHTDGGSWVLLQYVAPNYLAYTNQQSLPTLSILGNHPDLISVTSSSVPNPISWPPVGPAGQNVVFGGGNTLTLSVNTQQNCC